MVFTAIYELSSGDGYINRISKSVKYEISVPNDPGDHEQEIKLVESFDRLVNVGEVIGQLHEDLTRECEARKEKERLEADKGAPTDMPPELEGEGAA